jgi:hypothetical protein
VEKETNHHDFINKIVEQVHEIRGPMMKISDFKRKNTFLILFFKGAQRLSKMKFGKP